MTNLTREGEWLVDLDEVARRPRGTWMTVWLCRAGVHRWKPTAIRSGLLGMVFRRRCRWCGEVEEVYWA